jgi:hypothetical protein
MTRGDLIRMLERDLELGYDLDDLVQAIIIERSDGSGPWVIIRLVGEGYEGSGFLLDDDPKVITAEEVAKAPASVEELLKDAYGVIELNPKPVVP